MFLHPPPHPAVQCAADFDSLSAQDIARLLCALARLPQAQGSSERFQRLNLLVETRSAVFRDADHRLIADTWLSLANPGRARAVRRRRAQKAAGALPAQRRGNAKAAKDATAASMAYSHGQ